MGSLEVNFDIAKLAGVNAAIVLSLIDLRTRNARATDPDFHGDRKWTRASMESLARDLPFLSVAAVRTAIRKLKAEKLVLTRNFNPTPYDHTAWYALTERSRKLIKSSACRQ